MGNYSKKHKLQLLHSSITKFDHFLTEANTVDYIKRVDRTLDRAINRLQPVFSRMFNRQFTEVKKRLEVFEPLLQESVQDDKAKARKRWIAIWRAVVRITSEQPADSLQDIGEAVFQEGAESLLTFLGNPAPISFELINRAAIRYRRSDKAIKDINETTQNLVTSLIDQAVEEGFSYTKFQRQLSERFEEFSRKRAKRIAVFEIRDRHAGGEEETARQLKKQGVTVEKRWVSRGDNKVRPDHEDYDKMGYIPEEDEFLADSGNSVPRPPTDPGCRCVVVRRIRIE